MFFCVYVCFIAMFISGIDSGNIENKIVKYFDSDAVKLLQKTWETHKTAFENAVLVTITETYGYKNMNVYVKKANDPLKLSSGFLHSDNQVQLLLLNLELEQLPHLLLPQVSFDLPHNILQLEGSISKMIVHADYLVFRNKSDIIYALQDQNPNENSPFRFQQVQTMGKLAIVIEGCVFSGGLLAVLNGQTVNLGHSILELSKCLYTFEISTPGFGGPPVIVRYNANNEGLSLEHLLLKPLRNELMPKLHAAMFSYINTSAILGADFPRIRHEQEDILKESSNYINNVVRSANKLTIKKNQGIMEMEDFTINWDDALEGGTNSSVIELRKMVLTGLDSLYSAHIGGPYKLPVMKISEEIRFDFLQVRGEIYFGNEVTQGSYEFSVEIRDVAAQITVVINAEDNRRTKYGKKWLHASKSMKRFEIIGWRTIDFVIPGIDFISTESFITGYLLNTLPKYLVKHLHEVFSEVSEEQNFNGIEEQRAVGNMKEEEELDTSEGNMAEEGENDQISENNEDPVEHVSDAQEQSVEEQETPDANDNIEEHASEQEHIDEQEEVTGSAVNSVENNDENSDLLNDKPEGLSEPSDEVDKHISRQRRNKIKDKKHSGKIKSVTDNEV